MLWPGPLLYSPFLAPPAPSEDPSRAKAAAAAASRESTAALKAWLGRHLKNPYPSKGEKVLLALVSRMSLTQVSTWFANARRRLKKESCGAPGWPPSPAAAASSSTRQIPASSAPWRKPADARRESPKIWRVAELAVGASERDVSEAERGSPGPRPGAASGGLVEHCGGGDESRGGLQLHGRPARGGLKRRGAGWERAACLRSPS